MPLPICARCCHVVGNGIAAAVLPLFSAFMLPAMHDSHAACFAIISPCSLHMLMLLRQAMLRQRAVAMTAIVYAADAVFRRRFFTPITPLRHSSPPLIFTQNVGP